MDQLEILKILILEEDQERMETPPKTFEDDPINFILNKYQNLKEILVYLLSENFKEYLTAIYIVAPKPTTFKIILHNGQYFFLTFMGEAYQATISGKNYFLLTVGEKQRAMQAIARLLRFGNPLKTKGPEGAEDSGKEDDLGSEEVSGEGDFGAEETTGGEEETLEESKKLDLDILLEVIKKAPVLDIPRPNTGTNETSLKEGLVCLFFDVSKNKSLKKQIEAFYPKLKNVKEEIKVEDVDPMITKISSIFHENKSNYGAGKSSPENLDQYVRYVFLTRKEIDTLTNAIAAAFEISKSISNSGQIIRNETFDSIRAKATELIKKDYSIDLYPDNWCPGDVYLVKDQASVKKALAAKSVNIGKDSLNSVFKEKEGLIAISLKEEKAQAGKATTFTDTVFKQSFNAKIDPKDKFGTSDNKSLAKISADINRFEDYYYGKSKSGKRKQSYIDAITKSGKIHKSVNSILNYAGLQKINTKKGIVQASNEKEFYDKNKALFDNLVLSIKKIKSKLEQKDSVKDIKSKFLKARSEFIKNISNYDIKVSAENSSTFLNDIMKTNDDPISVTSKKIATYELAIKIIEKWTDETAELSPAYKKIQDLINPFAALTAFAIASAGISPSFWKVMGNHNDIQGGKSDFFDSSANIDIDSKTSKIELLDSPNQSGFMLRYITLFGTHKYLTELTFRFSGSEIRIEVQKLKKL